MSLRDRLNASPHAREYSRLDELEARAADLERRYESSPLPAVLEPVRFTALAIAVAALTLLATCVGGMACGSMVARAQVGQEAAIEAALLRRVQLPMERADHTHPFIAHCRAAREGCPARIHHFAQLFNRFGLQYDVDPFVLAAIAFRESGLNPEAHGAAGEIGIMQLHPASRHGRWAARECRRDPGDCDAIIVQTAAALLRSGITHCGDLSSALGFYNRGQCGETSYSRAVLRLRDEMRGES